MYYPKTKNRVGSTLTTETWPWEPDDSAHNSVTFVKWRHYLMLQYMLRMNCHNKGMASVA